MTRPPAGPSEIPLDARETEILRSVIRAHIGTGEPVGSRAVSRDVALDLSPATIRNIMADLEERGLLVQPHTSAGRVPTERAYRLYVERLMKRARVADSEARAIDEALGRSRGEVQELLAEACRQLSRFSHHVGVVLAPEFRRIVVERIELVRLDARRAVAILVDRTGVVHNRILELEEPLEQDELDRIGRHLSGQFAGRTLPEMRREILEGMQAESAAYDRLLARALELGRKATEGAEGGADVYVEGASNLVGSPDFADLSKMKALLRTLEEKNRLVEILSRVLEGEGVQVVIGRETPGLELPDLSLVASTYRSGDRVMGTVGVVGPTRMEYAQTIALVDHLARVLTRLLSSPGN